MHSQLDANYSKLSMKTAAIANVTSIVFCYLVSVLSLGHILMSNFVVANLFMHLLPGMILLYLTTPFYTKTIFAQDINYVTIQLYAVLTGYSNRSLITSSQSIIYSYSYLTTCIASLLAKQLSNEIASYLAIIANYVASQLLCS